MPDKVIAKHRSQCRTVADILHTLERCDGERITSIVHEANIPYGRLVEHLINMERSGLILRIDKDESYKITEKGRKFLVEFRKFEEVGEIFGVRI